MYACAGWNAFLHCVPSWVLLCSFAMLLSSIFVECVHVQYRNQLNATMSMNDMIVNCVYIYIYTLISLNSSNCACKSGGSYPAMAELTQGVSLLASTGSRVSTFKTEATTSST